MGFEESVASVFHCSNLPSILTGTRDGCFTFEEVKIQYVTHSRVLYWYSVNYTSQASPVLPTPKAHLTLSSLSLSLSLSLSSPLDPAAQRSDLSRKSPLPSPNHTTSKTSPCRSLPSLHCSRQPSELIPPFPLGLSEVRSQNLQSSHGSRQV
jgi:hypothetical protein